MFLSLILLSVLAYLISSFLKFSFSHSTVSLPNWIIVGQGPTVLAVGAGRGCLAISFSFLLETAR